MPLKTPARVLGIDPGYERLGLATLTREGSKEILISSTCLRTPKEHSLPERIAILRTGLRAYIEENKPDVLATEKIFFSKSRSTALGIAEVRGMLMTIAAEFNLPVFEYSPQEVKIAVTGYGASDKKAVSAMVERLISLPPKKRLDDELDAIAIGITCIASTRTHYPH